MDLAEVSIGPQLLAFESMITTNPVVATILERMPTLGLSDCWLTAGCLFQTVWNVLGGVDPQAGIRDYDLNYFDGADLSWDAEDRQITRVTREFADVDATVEVRNEARVHLWYAAKFGVPCPQYRNTRHAISTFPNCSSCVGVRPTGKRLEVFAPFGLSDLFAMTARPNPVLAPAAVYEAKTNRWRQQWPGLTVLPWPNSTGGPANPEPQTRTRTRTPNPNPGRSEGD